MNTIPQREQKHHFSSHTSLAQRLASVPISPPTMLSFYSSSSLSSSPALTSDPQPPQTNPRLNPEQEAESESESEAEAEAAYKLIPALPDDMALNCLARVPRSHHRTLSLVSKPIRSLLFSPLFINAYSILRPNQPLLCISLHLGDSPCRLFALSLNNPLAITLPLSPIPSPTFYPSYALLGHDIYVIGGGFRGRRSPLVWVRDCHLNHWRQGPTMLVPRQSATTAVLDGKIYVMGGCDLESSIWAEVLDPAVGSWEEVISPFNGRTSVHTCVAVGGKLYTKGMYAYDPRNRVWERLEREVRFMWQWSVCLVGGVLYCNSLDKIEGLEVRDVMEGGIWKWKEVKGLDKDLPPYWGTSATLAGVGGKLFLVWKCKSTEGVGKKHHIWCSQVEVHKDEHGELWGTVCWCKKIISFYENFMLERCFAVDL